MLNGVAFQRLFPNLYSHGIQDLREMKMKLKLSGKINSSHEKIWSVIGYSCANPLLRLKLTISDGVDTYKIFYSEEITQFRGNKIPKISAVNNGLFTRFSLKISGLESICLFENKENVIPLIKIAS